MKATEKCFSFAAVLLASGMCHAGIIYDEVISGDLEALDPRVFALESGLNRVLGNASYIGGGTFDFDSFNVSLQPGQTLTDVQFVITWLAFVPGTNMLQSDLQLRLGSVANPVVETSTVVDLLGPSVQTLFSDALPLDGPLSLGLYNQSLNVSGETIGVDYGGAWNYEVRFAVTPEPAALSMMGLGLALLGSVRLRRPRRKAVHASYDDNAPVAS